MSARPAWAPLGSKRPILPVPKGFRGVRGSKAFGYHGGQASQAFGGLYGKELRDVPMRGKPPLKKTYRRAPTKLPVRKKSR